MTHPYAFDKLDDGRWKCITCGVISQSRFNDNHLPGCVQDLGPRPQRRVGPGRLDGASGKELHDRLMRWQEEDREQEREQLRSER